MRRTFLTSLALALVLSALNIGTVAAACNPNRASQVVSRSWGARSTANSGVKFEQLTATIDNTHIPYIETATGKTYAIIKLRDNGGGVFYAGLRWSGGQGKLSSTRIRVIITDEAGNPNIDWLSNTVGSFTASYTSLTVSINLVHGSAPAAELYTVTVDGYQVGGEWLLANGPESFEHAEVFSNTDNNGSQVPGGTNNTQFFGSITYRSNYGTGTWSPDTSISFASYGRETHGPGYVGTWDSACANP